MKESEEGAHQKCGEVIVTGILLDENPPVLDISMLDFPHYYSSSFQPIVGPSRGLFLLAVGPDQEDILDERLDMLDSALMLQGISTTRLDEPNLNVAIEHHASNWEHIKSALDSPFSSWSSHSEST